MVRKTCPIVVDSDVNEPAIVLYNNSENRNPLGIFTSKESFSQFCKDHAKQWLKLRLNGSSFNDPTGLVFSDPLPVFYLGINTVSLNPVCNNHNFGGPNWYTAKVRDQLTSLVVVTNRTFEKTQETLRAEIEAELKLETIAVAALDDLRAKRNQTKSQKAKKCKPRSKWARLK